MPFFDNLKSFIREKLAKSSIQAQHKCMDEDLRDTMNARGQIILSNHARYKRLIDLARVDAALERLENDTFGICIGCGDQMDLAQMKVALTRLAAMADDAQSIAIASAHAGRTGKQAAPTGQCLSNAHIVDHALGLPEP